MNSTVLILHCKAITSKQDLSVDKSKHVSGNGNINTVILLIPTSNYYSFLAIFKVNCFMCFGAVCVGFSLQCKSSDLPKLNGKISPVSWPVIFIDIFIECFLTCKMCGLFATQSS